MKRLPQYSRRQGGQKYHNHAPNTTRRENVRLTGAGETGRRGQQDGAGGCPLVTTGRRLQKISVDIQPPLWYIILAGQVAPLLHTPHHTGDSEHNPNQTGRKGRYKNEHNHNRNPQGL
nr:MAG TPA: hypothetical protein [Caudoviricetes sp.]